VVFLLLFQSFSAVIPISSDFTSCLHLRFTSTKVRFGGNLAVARHKPTGGIARTNHPLHMVTSLELIGDGSLRLFFLLVWQDFFDSIFFWNFVGVFSLINVLNAGILKIDDQMWQLTYWCRFCTSISILDFSQPGSVLSIIVSSRLPTLGIFTFDEQSLSKFLGSKVLKLPIGLFICI